MAIGCVKIGRSSENDESVLSCVRVLVEARLEALEAVTSASQNHITKGLLALS